MLNPSTADHERDDPTIRTLIRIADGWGYGGLHVINLFAFRSSSPAEMRSADDPVGPCNDAAVRAALRCAAYDDLPVLAAWGNGGDYRNRDIWFCGVAGMFGVRLICLGTTIGGSPKHPLARGRHRIPRDQQPIMWVGGAPADMEPAA